MYNARRLALNYSLIISSDAPGNVHFGLRSLYFSHNLIDETSKEEKR
jgi:hypothetical protein